MSAHDIELEADKWEELEALRLELDEEGDE